MLKTPASTLPGVTHTLDFVKNLWGSMSIPGATMPGMPGMPGMPSIPGMPGLGGPALSTEELEKRITDLKAVEAWLNMNLTMLRGTIQALEVQRGTLAALKSMGDSMTEAMRQSGVGDKMGANPFAAFFAPLGQPPAGKPGDAAAKSAGGGTAQPGAAAAGGANAGGANAGAANAGADAGAAMQVAVGWWNLMQDQFRQAVSTAMTPGTPAADANPAAPSTASPAATPDAAPDGGNGGNGGNGGGKTRTPRPKADKP